MIIPTNQKLIFSCNQQPLQLLHDTQHQFLLKPPPNDLNSNGESQGLLQVIILVNL